MSNVYRIVLSGGPCSGKTTVIRQLEKIYTEKGYNVIIVPESAREIIGEGVNRSDILAFETAVVMRQLENEQKAEDNANDKTVIFYDRGLTDAFSYLNDSDKKILQRELQVTDISVWNRYDAVLFLETSAISDIYENDEERCESTEDAVKCHIALLKEWMGHPHLRYIKSTKSMDDKISDVVAEIDCIVNNIEHEKKYLIECPTCEFFEKYLHFKAEIEQIYLLSERGSHRIRKRGANGDYQYFETLKIRLTGDKCIEYEHTINADAYEMLKHIADPSKHPIVKDRYCLLYKGQYFEIDIFPFWNDKALLELELSSDNQVVELPPEIKLIKDVSEDKEYKNNYLAGLKL